MNSNKRLELLTFSVIGAVFLICITLTNLGFIPLWLAVVIAIASLLVSGLVACLIMWVFLGPTRYLEFIKEAKFQQNTLLAVRDLKREGKETVVDVVREITGLDSQRAEVVYKAFVSEDWSKVATNELHVLKPSNPLWAFQEKGPKATLKARLATAIIIEKSRRASVDSYHELMDPLEEKFSAAMAELAAKSELGYQKATASYFASGAHPDNKTHMRYWYRKMETVLNDQSNPEKAAALRATLEREYATITMPDWDKRQIEKLLGK
jgi:hypothetical protein